MTKEQILEGNKLIAEFMCERFEYFNGSIALSHEEEGVWYYDTVVYLDYNLDWSLLMPVLVKLKKEIKPISKGNKVDNRGVLFIQNIKEVILSGDKEKVWESAVACIKWLNLNKK